MFIRDFSIAAVGAWERSSVAPARPLKRRADRVRYVGLAGLILIAVLTVSSVSAQVSGEAAEAAITTAPVEIDGVELFRVRGVSSYPAAERARRIKERIEGAAADPTISIDSLRVV